MRKTFSITNKSVLTKLDTVDNQSKYIQELILKDIIENGELEDYRETVDATIMHILGQIEGIIKLLREVDK